MRNPLYGLQVNRDDKNYKHVWSKTPIPYLDPIHEDPYPSEFNPTPNFF